MNAVITTHQSAASLVPEGIDQAIRLATAMSSAKVVPGHLQGDVGSCLMVVEQAMRWQMSPFAVAQCTSVIQGKLMFEGKLVAAALNASGILSSRLDYDFSGKDAQRAVTVRGTLRGETKAREVTVFLADAKTSNGVWTKQPDQQLVYAGTRVWARRHAPEVMLGVYAPEEFDRAEPFDGPTIEHTASDERAAINDAVPLKPAAAATPRGKRKVDPNVYETGAETDEQKWLRNLETKLSLARSRAEVVAVGGLKSVKDAVQSGPPEVRRRVSELLADAFERLPEEEFTDEKLGEVEIAGEEKMAAGD